MSKYDPYIVDDNESSCDDAEEVDSEDDEEEEDEENLQDTNPALESLFSEATSTGGGNFTCGGKLSSNFGLPGLEIIIPKTSVTQSSSSSDDASQYDYKPIALPILSKEQANELISQCSKAPYGKGEETIYDDEVRNSWQLSPSQFRIANKNWDDMLNELIDGELKRGLGINENVSVKCSLYKLLLYEEGGHFEFHRDTEKEDRMFATMVIQLPSVYKGGNIIVKHGLSEEVYDLSNEASYTPFFFSFYCDCKHKVDVVTSGYRLCLIYNVCYTSGSKPIITDNTAHITRINEIVNYWCFSSPMACYLLEHKYSTAGLSFDYLKGGDTKVLQLLRQYNSKYPEDSIEILLGMMIKTETGYGEPYHITWEEKFYSLKHLISESGEVYSDVKRFQLNEDDIFPEDLLKDLQKSGEEIEEHTGNEGATAERWYKSACFIIYPKKFKYLMALKFGSSSAHQGLKDLWKAYKQDPSLRNQLVQYLRDFIDRHLGTCNVGSYISELKEISLAKHLLSKHECDNGDVIQIVSSIGIDPLRSNITAYYRGRNFNSLAQFLEAHPDSTLAKELVPYLLSKIDGHYYMYTRIDSINYEKALEICSKYNIDLNVETKKKILSKSSFTTSQLHELGCKLRDVFCLQEVLRRSFSINVNPRVYYHRCGIEPNTNTLPVRTIVSCIQIIGLDNCRTMLDQLISSFVTMNNYASIDTIQSISNDTANVHVTDFITSTIIKYIMQKQDLKSQNIQIYEKMLIEFYKCGAIKEMDDLVKIILSNASSTQYYHSNINPLIISISRSNMNVINSQPLQYLVRKCIQYYDSVITQQSNIPTPTNWVINATISCSCGNCNEVKSFLKSPTQTTHSIKASMNLRSHVESEARKATVDLKYDTLRNGSPHTLVLTKIRKSEELKQRAIQESTLARTNLISLVKKEGSASSDPPKKKVKSEH